MKTLILLLYYDRPEMVRGALRSIAQAGENHPDWELAFIDDSSPHPGMLVVEEELPEYGKQIKFYHTRTTLEGKKQHGGVVGKFINQAILDSDADIAFMLCDDDQLCPDYLHNLSNYFKTHDNDCCYSHVHLFNPLFENPKHAIRDDPGLNHTEWIKPGDRVDASQVAWRTRMNTQDNVWFPSQKTRCLDAYYFGQIAARHPEGIPFSGFVGQYKAIHITQLSHNSELEIWDGKGIDIEDGRKLTPLWEIHGLVNGYIEYGNLAEAARICTLGLSLHPKDPTLKQFKDYLAGIQNSRLS